MASLGIIRARRDPKSPKFRSRSFPAESYIWYRTYGQHDTETMFDKCARELEKNGYALLSLPALPTETKRDENVVAGAFNSARRALDDTRTNATPLIDPTTDRVSCSHRCPWSIQSTPRGLRI